MLSLSVLGCRWRFHIGESGLSLSLAAGWLMTILPTLIGVGGAMDMMAVPLLTSGSVGTDDLSLLGGKSSEA